MTPVAMIVSAGPGIDPEYYRTGDHYYAVGGSSTTGEGKRPRSMRWRSRTLPKKSRRRELTSVGVVSKFCVRNPSHEILIRRILQ